MIRPPYSDEKLANWESSAAGFREHDERWVFVPPAENVFTVFPGKFTSRYTRYLLTVFGL
jgi:isopenicillin N synthase-like dioxygenase